MSRKNYSLEEDQAIIDAIDFAVCNGLPEIEGIKNASEKIGRSVISITKRWYTKIKKNIYLQDNQEQQSFEVNEVEKLTCNQIESNPEEIQKKNDNGVSVDLKELKEQNYFLIQEVSKIKDVILNANNNSDDELSLKNKELISKNNKMTLYVESMKIELDESNKRNTSLMKSIQNLEKEVETFKKELQSKNTKELLNKIDSLEKERDKLIGIHNKAMDNISELRAQNSLLKIETKNNKVIIESLKTELSKFKNDNKTSKKQGEIEPRTFRMDWNGNLELVK
jgi:chromosome segregation ATPase